MHAKNNVPWTLSAISATVALLFAAAAPALLGQSMDLQSCRRILENSCSGCHGLEKTCAKLDQPDANWPAIVTVMGLRANLSIEVRDQVLACMTTSRQPKKLVCPP